MMPGRWIHALSCGNTGLVGLVLALATTAARADYFVPSACQSGEGYYTGDFDSDGNTYETIEHLDGDEFLLYFQNDLILEWSGGDAIGQEFANVFIEDDGHFFISRVDPGTFYELQIEGDYFDCGISGSYALYYDDGGPDAFGDFFMEAYVDPCDGDCGCDGSNCDDDDDDDDDDDGPLGNIFINCGPQNAAGAGELMFMGLALFAAKGSLRRRRRGK